MLGSSITFFQTLSSNSYENRLDIVDVGFRLRDQARGVNTYSANPSDLTTASFRSTTAGSLRQGIRNITAAVSMIATASQALMELAGNLTSMRALAVAAAETGQTDLENKILNYEFSAVIKDIQTKATETSWGGRNLLDGSLGVIKLQVGAYNGENIEIISPDINIDFGISELVQAGLDSNTASDFDIFTNLSVSEASIAKGDESIDLNAQVITGSNHNSTLTYLDNAAAGVTRHRNNLSIALDRMTTITEQLDFRAGITSDSISKILESEGAIDTAKLTHAQIIQQVSLAQIS